MATCANSTDTSYETTNSNVITMPLRRRSGPAFALGVNPFDPSNPAHVNAWNTIHRLGWAEQAAKRGAE